MFYQFQCLAHANASERSEFVTNAYKNSASVANFERMSNLFIRKHIRKHIRLCVRAALVKKMFFASANSAKMPFLLSRFPMVCPQFVSFPAECIE